MNRSIIPGKNPVANDLKRKFFLGLRRDTTVISPSLYFPPYVEGKPSNYYSKFINIYIIICHCTFVVAIRK